jgi:predicted AlkP superfamily pyrophosphatase or phosphodiesterase
MLTKLLTTTAVAISLAAAMPASLSHADGRDSWGVQHVLLLSIDGFHSVDLEVCVATGACPNLSRLTHHGITYTNASTTKPSDSFPGLLAQVTGGTSKSTGVF